MALPFRTLKKNNSLQSYIRKQNTAVADIFRNGFFENVAPSVALNSPADAGTTTDTTPTLDFTGADQEGNDVRFNLQLCNDNLFLPVAPEIRSSSQNSAASGSPSVAAPAGAQVGDKMIVVVAVNGQTTIADNNGSTPFDEDINDYKPNTSSGQTISVFSRIIQAGDPATYNFTPGTTGRWSAVAICLKGGAYDIAPSTGNAANDDSASSGTINAPSITVGNNSLHIVVCNWDTAAIGTITTPSGYTLIQNANDGGNPLHASYKAFASGGATGAVTCQNTEFGAMIAFSFSVKSRTSLLLDKVSGTDAGFANPDNGGDTDPFNSGENIQYTVQAGDALAVGTYYWRVRGIDPSGSNQWGAWSATRSFEVTSGGGSYQQVCSETIAMGDEMAHITGRILAESLTVSDSLRKLTSRVLAESVSMTDALAKTASRVLTETIVISDSIQRILSRILSEAVNMIDTVAKAIARMLSDSTTVSDSSNQAKVTLKVVSDSISMADSIAKLSGKVFAEAVSMADNIIRRAARVLSETVGVVDSIRKSVTRIILDSTGVSDILRKTTAKTLSDNATATDLIQKKVAKIIFDIANIADSLSLSRAIQRVMSDVVSVSDSVSRSIGRTFSETIFVLDSIVGAIVRGVSKFVGILRSIYPINTTLKANAKGFILNSKNTAITLKNNGRSGIIRGNNNQFTKKL